MHNDINEVQDGFILRWFQQSLEIIVKNPIIWIFFICLMSISSLIPINLFFKSFIGLWLMLGGIELCIMSEANRITFKGFLNILKRASDGFLLQIHFKVIFYSLMFSVFAFVSEYAGEMKTTMWINNIYWIYGLGFLSLAGIGFQIFTHLYSRFFDSSNKRLVNYKCKLASKMNYKVELFFKIFVIVNITIISLVCPIMVVMLYPISCALVYVAFKEIFFKQNDGKLKNLLQKEINAYELG